MMFVEKLALEMLKKENPKSIVKFNGSNSPDFTITHNNGFREYVEIKSINRKDGKLQLKCRQINKIRELPEAWLWVFDCHDKLICKTPMEPLIPAVTKQITGVKTIKIVWHGLNDNGGFNSQSGRKG